MRSYSLEERETLIHKVFRWVWRLLAEAPHWPWRLLSSGRRSLRGLRPTQYRSAWSCI